MMKKKSICWSLTINMLSTVHFVYKLYKLEGPLDNYSLQLQKRGVRHFFRISRVHFPHFQGRVSTFKRPFFHTLRGPFSTFQSFIFHNSRVHFPHFRGRIFHISKVYSRVHFHISRADFSHLQAIVFTL